MQVELSDAQRVWSAAARTWEHWFCIFVMAWLAFVSWALWYRTRSHGLERRKDRLLREELETYARLDPRIPPGGDVRSFAKRICRMLAEKSAFRQTALLLRDVEGRIYVAASTAMDDAAIATLTGWGQQVVQQEHSSAGVPSDIDGPHTQNARVPHSSQSHRDGWDVHGPGVPQQTSASPVATTTPSRQRAKSLTLDMPSPMARSGEPAILKQAILLPLLTTKGRITGAIAVCPQPALPEWMPALDEAIPPLEALAAKLARSMENDALTERLLRVEKLAGLGQLAGGVAHELNNPLTAVLGFAELIVESSAELRVREDAHTIVTQALRMREIVQNLVDFWRPIGQADLAVDMRRLVREAVANCGAKLAQRGVRLVVAAPESIPPVRGNVDRLRVVLEHLLTNAAQALELQKADALAAAHENSGRLPRVDADPPTIRITLCEVGNGTASMVHLVVSDTGLGFREPSRVFDPFYTTRQPGEGSGLGLSICYGIAREHGGEISAFNLHPHGAAVVVELPVRQVVAGESLSPYLNSAKPVGCPISRF
jgi:signal transduction histidine kinase